MTPGERSVRTGELAAAPADGPVLMSVGLGSCVGLVLLDADNRVAGLAHVMLPAQPNRGHKSPGKYGDTVVPALLDCVERAGAERSSLLAVLVGAARMFSFSSLAGADIGARNEAAVRAALQSEQIPIAVSDTGGSAGRTVRVLAAEGVVVVREVYGELRELYRANDKQIPILQSRGA